MGTAFHKIHLKLVKHAAVSPAPRNTLFCTQSSCAVSCHKHSSAPLAQDTAPAPEEGHWQWLGQAPAWKLSLTQGHNSQPTCSSCSQSSPTPCSHTNSSRRASHRQQSTAESSLDSCLLKPVIKDVLVLPALESKVPHDCILHLVKAIQLD